MADMEALLMDDSSSGDSDNDNEASKVPASTSAVAATVQPTASPTPPQQQAAPPAAAAPAAAAPAPAASASDTSAPTNKSELSQRLKSLYSPANHAAKKQVPASQPQPSTNQPVQQQPASTQQGSRSPHRPQQQQQPAPSQQFQQHPSSSSAQAPHHNMPPSAPGQRPVSQSGRSSSGGMPAPSSLSRGSSGIKHSVSSQQPSNYTNHPGSQQQQQQPRYSSQPSSSQHRPSSSSQQQQQQQQPPYGQPPSSSYGRSNSSGQHRSSSGGSSSQRPSGSGVPNPVPGPGHGAVPPPGQRRGNVAAAHSNDPSSSFDPTPLSRIRDREKEAMAANARRSSGGSSSGYPGASSGTSRSSAVPASSSTSEREKEMRRQKERFLMFTRVLMKYLETKDPPLHAKVKAIIKDCAERNKRQEPGYESVTASMRERLKQVVGDAYWKRAESYLSHFLAQKKQQQGASSSSSSSSNKPSSGGIGGAIDPRAAAELKRKESERRKALLQQQQQERNRMGPPLQQPPTQQPPMAAPQTTQQASSTSTQAAPTQTVKPARTATGGKGGKRASSGGKQAGGKAPKKARTNKSATTTTGRGSKTPQSPMSPPGQQQPTTSAASTPNPMTGAGIGAMDTARPPSPPPTREYNELMEAVDHSMFFDWTAAGLIMGSNTQKLQLQEEQKNLLYGSTATYNVPDASANQSQIQSPKSPDAMDWKRESSTGAALQPEDESGKTSFALRGWGKRNLVSPRVAWCRVRRREQITEQKRAEIRALYPNAPPIPTPASAWLNEEKAEDDPVLCLLSEATQIYATQVLQKALVCARQRQNLDGIRLWHQQCTAAIEHAKLKKKTTNGDKDTGSGEGEEEKKFEPPPLSIKLGCDVTRQVARTMGNAALTVKRMEEALERAKPYELTRAVPSKEGFQMDEATFKAASSMGELSLLPPLANAVDKAEHESKRQFEVYGGKYALEPPLGRVPEKVKVEAADFDRGLELNHFLGGHQSRRHRANPRSFSWNV